MPKKTAAAATKAENKRFQSRLQETPIAIVGMASIFADATTVDKYWDNILDSVNSIIDVPADRWAIDDYYSADKSAPDKTYCKRGAFMPEVDFDPMEFGLPPNILEVTDIAQLIALVVAKEVIKDAGVADEAKFDRDRMGITMGVGGGLKQIGALNARLQYPVLEKVLASCGVEGADRDAIIEKFKKAYIPWEENSFPGMLGNVIAGRVANRFNLGGTNCTVDAACAGALAAIKLAVSDLLEYRSDMMISGGICCDNSPFMYMSFSKTPAFSTNDDIRPFDDDSKGMMVGEGVGMIMLKRLEDAERDGDRVYAVIKGIGTSSDGRFKSIYAPRPDGQARALRRAYEDAGFDPKTVGSIEAHGTGTMAGDAAEFSGLSKYFGIDNEQRNQIALGSVKSQIGHTKSAAGAAGIIKQCLALHHKILPATINVDKPSTQLDIANSPFYINTETRPWLPRTDGIPRRAGVSSFGFGGTNFHFVLEEHKPKAEGAYRLSTVPQNFLIAGDDAKAIASHLEAMQQSLNVVADDQIYAFNRAAKDNSLRSLAKGQARLAFVAKNIDELLGYIEQSLKQLSAKPDAESWDMPTGIYYRKTGLDSQGKVVALFSGQGSQYLNMGRELACNMPEVLEAAAAIDSEFAANGLAKLSDVSYPVPVFNAADRAAQEARLQLTQFAQPAIGSFSVGLYKALSNAGFKADFTAGHSFGELTALWAAGVVNDADYFMLARSRGQAMAAPDDKNFDAGTMIAVVGDVSTVAAEIKSIKGVEIANFNSNNQVVLAGETAAVQLAFEHLKTKGFKVVALPVSAAFHTPLVGHAQKPFAAAIEKAKFNKPAIPVFANGTGLQHSDKAADIKKVLKQHILEPVKFNTEIDSIYAAGGRVFVEFGPKNVLSRLVDNILADKTDVVTVAINANPKKSSDTQMRQAVAQLAVYGLALEAFDPYQATPLEVEAPKRSPMSMKLSAASYVSPKTKDAFTAALNDGYKIQSAQTQVVEKIVERIVEVPGPAVSGTLLPQANNANNSDVLASIEHSVSEFYHHQKQVLDVHEQYMQGPKDYASTFQQVLQNQAGAGQLPESLDKTLAMYHDFQTDTLRVHEQYLNAQADNVSQMMGDVQNRYQSLSGTIASPAAATVNTPSPVARPAPIVAAVAPVAVTKPAVAAPVVAVAASVAAPVTQTAAVNVAKIQSVMMAVVADKTGYPAEMLELEMDMEADLGIDSIKRVEILGAVQDDIPNLPELNPEDLAELRTLGQIVDYMQSKAGAVASAVPVAQAAAHSSSVASSAVDVAKIQSVMMAVVADKTGYPAEMLELEMDMEADLGIDSIKRVEILGAVQDDIPNLPELNPEDLAELRTLGQIVDYMQSKAGAVASATPVAQAVAHTSTAASSAVDVAKIQSVMMAVVADKTGYPAEMLELEMDMEADLGIDSIKRVEILGAVQDDIPNLPELNPEDLAELRTLGQIVNYMQSKAGAVASVAPIAQAAAAQSASVSTVVSASVDVAKIQSVMMAVVADKTGYPAEMLELEMDMEADLGIDSIKRVEILGAVQDDIPNLPELNPEDLSELRTLGQIVSYMQAKSAAVAVTSSSAPSAAASSVDSANFSTALMAVVSEKTGYPVEMLELEMDMEADLGIDSIKRVEILGAVQDSLPGLPEVNAETLAEMRTLAEIVAVFSDSSAATAVVANDAAHAPSATVAIERLASVNRLEHDIHAMNYLLVDDGQGTAAHLSQLLLDKGAAVAVLIPDWLKVAKKSPAYAAKVQQVHISDVTEETVASTIEALSSLQKVIYLQPSIAGKGVKFADDAKRGLKLAFLLAKYCNIKTQKTSRPTFFTVSRQGGQFGFSLDSGELVQAGLSGLVKTLAQEWPEVFCRSLDVSSKIAADTLAAVVMDELYDADTACNEVGIDEQGRLRLVAKATNSYDLVAGKTINADSVFLVSGGAKGVTAHCVIELAQQYKSKFILLGRSVFDANEPTWATGINDATALNKAAMQMLLDKGDKPTPVSVKKAVAPLLANREIAETLAAIEAAGAKAQYISVDVTDAAAMKKAVKPAIASFGAITGIIHGAGVLADKFIEQKTLQEFDAVFDTKVSGLVAMLATVNEDSLAHLVMFSSAAGFYGNPGQSDYAIANEVLNKTALRFKQLHPETQVLSFNWGPWDGGMVTAELKRMFSERGVYVIPLDAGAKLMASELAAADNRCVQILVGNDMGGEGEAVKK